jgi:hypothetical protein
MSPEYAMEGFFSIKSDVYSYGVLLLEIVSGLKISTPHHLIRDFQNLIDYVSAPKCLIFDQHEHNIANIRTNLLSFIVFQAWNLLKDGNEGDFLDTVLLESCSLHQVALCIRIGLLCVQDCPNARPLMSLVMSMLDNEAMPLTTPEQPLFVGRKRETEEARDSNSINNASLTTLAGR